jgi:hypothetical protein
MDIIEIIEQMVREIENEFQDSQGLILTEDDLKCHLFRKLYPHFDHSTNSIDSNIKAGPFHAELNYFDNYDVLNKRPDLAIFQTENLSILHSVNHEIDKVGIKYKHASGKEFEFSGNSVIFELKFCRNRNGINKRHVDSYKKDIKKIRELQRIANNKSNGTNKILGIIVIFNKTDKKIGIFDELFNLQDESLKIFYGTGKVDFSADDNYIHRFDE